MNIMCVCLQWWTIKSLKAKAEKTASNASCSSWCCLLHADSSRSLLVPTFSSLVHRSLTNILSKYVRFCRIVVEMQTWKRGKHGSYNGLLSGFFIRNRSHLELEGSGGTKAQGSQWGLDLGQGGASKSSPFLWLTCTFPSSSWSRGMRTSVYLLLLPPVWRQIFTSSVTRSRPWRRLSALTNAKSKAEMKA